MIEAVYTVPAVNTSKVCNVNYNSKKICYRRLTSEVRTFFADILWKAKTSSKPFCETQKTSSQTLFCISVKIMLYKTISYFIVLASSVKTLEVKTQNMACPRKDEKLTQCWFNVGPPSTTVGRHWASIGSLSYVCWGWFLWITDRTVNDSRWRQHVLWHSWRLLCRPQSLLYIDFITASPTVWYFPRISLHLTY